MTRALRAKVFLTAAVAVLTLLATAAWAEGSRDDGSPAPAEPSASSARETPIQPGADDPVEAAYRQTVRVWVHADDVRPRVIRAAPGAISLRAENETGGDVALVVEKVSAGGGAPEREARVVVTGEGRRARLELSLVAGEYVFYEESRPQFKGTLLVEPRDNQ
jgi:hypothetical protein